MDIEEAKLDVAAMCKELQPPYTMFLPKSHPFMRMSDEEFEYIAGPHVKRQAVLPIPMMPS